MLYVVLDLTTTYVYKNNIYEVDYDDDYSDDDDGISQGGAILIAIAIVGAFCCCCTVILSKTQKTEGTFCISVTTNCLLLKVSRNLLSS